MELERILKEMGETIETMDFMWEFLGEFHPLSIKLVQQGVKWYELSEPAIKSIPEAYNKTFFKVWSKKEGGSQNDNDK